MKQSSLFGAGPWPFIFLPLLLVLPLLAIEWHSIEEDVAQNAQAKLTASGAHWATAETFNRGRNVLITGTPPNDAAIEIARQAAESAYGVTTVVVSSDATPPTSKPELSTVITGDKVHLSGVLANSSSVDAIVSQAKLAFGSGNVTNRLSIHRNTAGLPALDGFFNSLIGKSFARETLTASLNGQVLTLNGTIKSDIANGELVTKMRDTLGLEVKSTLVIAPPPVKRDVCQDLVNDLLNNGKINFASTKADIEESSFTLLERIKITAFRCPDASFEVSGHTDSTGNLDFNMALSEQRAQAVVDYLVGQGLEVSQFSAAGYGPNKPLDDNNTETGRAENRRIEFKLKN